MSDPKVSALEIYIGSPIQHESERSTLNVIERLLAADKRKAVVLANISVDSRQTDFVVALDGLVLVIEAKSSSQPVQGGENGFWQVHLTSGNWKDFPNPYLQALDAAFAVKNAMRSFCKTNVPYVAAALVFAPDIPRGSTAFHGNHKVSVIGHDGLRALLRKQGKYIWSDSQWREFAEHLGLTRVSSVAAACDPLLVEAEGRLRNYTFMFCRTYRDAETLVPFSCGSNGETISSTDVMHLVSERCAGLLLHGPTGCGKSMLAASLGTAFSRHGGIVVTIQVKDFDGSLKKALNREVGLLDAPSAIRLLNDVQLLGRPVLFIVDGYNECSEDRQRLLTRGIAALAHKYEASILVTSQVSLARGALLELRKIDVFPPTMETKVAIANQASDDSALLKASEQLLAAVTSGLEARLVGEVGAASRPGSSRYGLFDAFARKRLGELASDCIHALSEVAAWLFDRFALSMSVRDFDRLMDYNGVSPALRRLILKRGLLTLRGDRVSFPHEMFFDAFAAEAIVRQANGQPELFLKALGAPLHSARKDLVIGAIDDDVLLEQLVPELEDYASITACLLGRCGSRAQELAEAHCRKLWSRLRDEACNARFKVGRQGWGNVGFESASLTRWSRSDQAFFGILPELIAGGRFLDETLDIIGILDRRIAEEFLRLHDEARKLEIELQTELFTSSYVVSAPSGGAPGISAICADLHTGVFMVRSGRFCNPEKGAAGIIKEELIGRDLSPGQLYLFLTLCRGVGIPASYLAGTIKTQWDDAPYHLRLALLESAGWCSGVDDTDRAGLIEAVEELLNRHNPLLSSMIFETLQLLGALDDFEQEHKAVVRQEIQNCLARPTECESQAEAWSIYSRQFDHPYSGAYLDILSGLTDHDRKTLWDMAAKGATETWFMLSPLLVDLASFGDPGVGESVAQWTALPPVDNRIMPQEDISVYVVAHIALARLGCSLPGNQTVASNPSAKALAACGSILYWSNRADLAEPRKLDACNHALDVLMRHGKVAALDVIHECEYSSPDGLQHLPGDTPVVRSIVGRFPYETAAICRDALLDPAVQIGYFAHFSDSSRSANLAFAIDVLKVYGRSADCSLLRQYATDRYHGKGAIAALKAIEERLVNQPKNSI